MGVWGCRLRNLQVFDLDVGACSFISAAYVGHCVYFMGLSMASWDSDD